MTEFSPVTKSMGLTDGILKNRYYKIQQVSIKRLNEHSTDITAKLIQDKDKNTRTEKFVRVFLIICQ